MKIHLREYCSIEAEGGALYAFINAIRHSDIRCLEQRCIGERFLCRIHKKDLPSLQKLADRHRMQLAVRTQPSLAAGYRRYRFRFGIPIGLLIGFCILFCYSNTVASIEIRGNSSVSDSAILAMLELEGVTAGKWITDIDFHRCEQQIRMKVPGVAWAALRHTGNRLVVEISEATPAPEMLQERMPGNIVSLYDAQITDVTVHNGHLARLIGDGVSEGELLVSGVYEDEKGHVTYHHAIASVTGIYEKEAELTEYFTVTETAETGSIHRRNFLQVFDLRIPLDLSTHDFAEYRESETTVPFSLLEHTLPVGIVQQTFTETATETRIRSEEETRLALNGAIVRYEKNFLADVEILERKTTFTQDENGITCRLVYTLEGEIGTFSDVFVK